MKNVDNRKIFRIIIYENRCKYMYIYIQHWLYVFIFIFKFYGENVKKLKISNS